MQFISIYNFDYYDPNVLGSKNKTRSIDERIGFQGIYQVENFTIAPHKKSQENVFCLKMPFDIVLEIQNQNGKKKKT